MLPHFSIHRRREQNWSARCERDGCKRMIGQTVRELGDDVRCRRRDQQQVRAVGELDVPGPPAFLLVKEAGCHRIFESVCNVSGEMNSVASRVMTTKTSWPCLTSKLASSADLYAAIDPVTPSTIDFVPGRMRTTFRPLALSRFLSESLPSAIISRSNAGSNNFLPP